MAEWSNAVVLKTIEPKGSGGSNPSLSATFIPKTSRGMRTHEFDAVVLASERGFLQKAVTNGTAIPLSPPLLSAIKTLGAHQKIDEPRQQGYKKPPPS